jgi:protein-L-isoaspartate(D-aspartate) O-methyltransferase
LKGFGVILLAVILPSWILAAEPADITQSRQTMVDSQIRNRGIRDLNVLRAMRQVPRHRFVPGKLISNAYADRPLPIGDGQTISQPYVVALMTEKLNLTGTERVLEIGTGSGYQAAILSKTAGDVYTIEIRETLYKKSTAVLRSLGFDNVHTRFGDGYFGWQEAAPFDAMMITAAVDHIPPPLLKQLKDGGRLILPLGNPFHFQHLTLVTKQSDDYKVKQITGVLFVPMTGHALEGTR